MGKSSQIQWTDATWNVAVGCKKVDADCKYCYMYRDSMNGTRYNPMIIRKTKTVFGLPLKLKEPSKIFTSSLTDLFLPELDEFRNEAWDIIKKCPQHTFQILTKRPDRIPECLPEFWNEISGRIWLGTSVGSQNGVHRIDELINSVRHINSFPKLFVSFEPLHEEILIPYTLTPFIDWVIIGGESGNETGKYLYRPCKIEWIESLMEQFQFSKIFVKQLGTHLAKEMKLSDRHGGDMDEWPEHLRIRQFPD